MRNSNRNIKISVVVPAYNEVDNIAPLMEEFSKMFSRTRMYGEVILVDDGSTDGTFLKAKECQQKYHFLRVVAHQRNRGLTEALMTGFSRARGKIFVFWPADLQYLPQDIPKLVQRIDPLVALEFHLYPKQIAVPWFLLQINLKPHRVVIIVNINIFIRPTDRFIVSINDLDIYLP